MHLTAANLPHYLIGQGLLTPEDVVGGNVTVADASRRNRNFKVTRDGPGLFVKQMRDMQTDAMLTLKREAACYELARGHATMSRLMPHLVRYDEGRSVLVLDLLPEAESLLNYHNRHRRFPIEIGRLFGQALGLYHSQTHGLVESETLRPLLLRQVPVILTLGRGGHDVLARFAQFGPAISALIRQHGEFQALLDALGAEWRFDSLVHGDMKWDNVLVFQTADGLDFRVVDWEMADLGDTAWDVGAVFQSFLSVWILSMPIAGGAVPESYVGLAAQPLDAMRPVLKAFWDSYADTRGFERARAKGELERCMRFGAARLVWAAIEQRLYVAQVDPAAAALLQVSFNVLKDPGRAVRELLDV